MDTADLTVEAQRVLAEIANQQMHGRIKVALPVIAKATGLKLQQLHGVVKELVAARAFQMERVGSDSGVAIARFHLSASPSRIIAELRRGQGTAD